MEKAQTQDVLLDGFATYLREEKGRREKTVENYQRYIARFLKHSHIRHAQDVSPEAIQSFLTWLSSQKTPGDKSLTNKTQNYYRIALRSFIQYLNTENKTVSDAKSITLLASEHSKPDTLTELECEALLECPCANTSMDLRDKAIVTTLLYTGMRISELCALRKENLSEKSFVFEVRGKNRTLPLYPEVTHALESYLSVRRDNDPALFVNNGKRNSEDGSIALTPRSVQRIVSAYAKKAGIEKTVTPKTLRHTRAMFVLQNGSDIDDFQKTLGYTHKTSTKAYLHLLNDIKK